MKWCRKKSASIHPIEEQQTEKLMEIGDFLRQKRMEQALSLEKAAAKTLIRQPLLQAIEKGKLDELPEPVYVQRLLKQYADVLGLDGKEIASSFPAGSSDRALKNTQPGWRLVLPVLQLRPIHLYLLYIIVIATSINALSQTLHRSVLPISDRFLEEPSSAKLEQAAPKSHEKVESVSATPKPARDKERQIKIGITLKAPSWIRVVADGKTQFQGVLPQGTQRTWVAKEELTVLAGNAGGVLLTINQEKSKQMGDLGEVQELTFAAPRL